MAMFSEYNGGFNGRLCPYNRIVLMFSIFVNELDFILWLKTVTFSKKVNMALLMLHLSEFGLNIYRFGFTLWDCNNNSLL
jgi:hypothetical protein